MKNYSAINNVKKKINKENEELKETNKKQMSTLQAVLCVKKKCCETAEDLHKKTNRTLRDTNLTHKEEIKDSQQEVLML